MRKLGRKKQGDGKLGGTSVEEEEVAEVLRACPQPVITHTALHNKLGKCRTRRAETADHAFDQPQAVLQRVADMGFGQVRRGRRDELLRKARICWLQRSGCAWTRQHFRPARKKAARAPCR